GTSPGLGFDTSGSFAIAGLTASTPQDQALSFNWDRVNSQYEIGGALQLQFNDNSLLANFGSSTAPGIVIQNGQLQSLAGYITGNIAIAGVSLSTQGITVNYDHDKAQFEMYGDLTLQV